MSTAVTAQPRPSRARRGARVLLSAALVLAALGGASWVQEHAPSMADVVREPFPHAGTLGHPMALRGARVTVTQVQAGRTVAATAGGSRTSAHGVFLAVTMEVQGRTEPASMRDLQVRATGGRLYTASLSQPGGSCGPVQPRQTWRCTTVWEMPADAVNGAVAVIAVGGSTRGDDVAEVPLGLSAADAHAAVTRTEPITVAPSGPGKERS